MDEIESVIRREIQNFLDRSNKKSCYQQMQHAGELVLKWRNTLNTANIRFVIHINRENVERFKISFILDIVFDDGDSEDDVYNHYELDLPQSEEEYFQMSTISDLGFSWEFYEYITEVLYKLRTK